MDDTSLAGFDGNGSGSSNKRKSEDSASQQRTKRNRYISIACNECKRRKIKCNGNAPCQRCGNLNLECVYAPNCCGSSFRDSDEYRRMTAQIASLQEQVDALFANLSSLRSDLAANITPIDPSLQNQAYLQHQSDVPTANMLSPNQQRGRSSAGPRRSTFHGPTSSDFNFDVAKNSLQTMGIVPSGQGAEGEGTTADASPAGSPHPEVRYHATKDPIWTVSREEASRLLQVYEDEMHELYPVVSIAHLSAHITSLYKFMDAARRNGLTLSDAPGADAIEDEDTNMLKIVLAIAMVVEGSGRSEPGERIFAYVRPKVDALLLGNAGIKDVRVLALTAMYEFNCDNEGTSWRVIGMTARLCIEMGLHRRPAYEAMTVTERDSAVLLFWAIYSLDRRWAFGTGMPFALQDSDIDPMLPRPGDKSPYLTAMIDYCSLGGKVWRSLDAEHNPAGTATSSSKEDIGFLDYQVIQWHRSLPEQLHYRHPSLGQPEQPTSSPGNHRLRVILYLRANGMRIQIHRPTLHSATSIVQNRALAQTVIDVAKDSIRVLTHINQTTTMYRRSQVLFNPMLTSALGVLFLAVSHAPALFAEQVREEFYMALDMVRGFSRGSFVSKRLWRTIRGLKEVGPKLGLATIQDSRPRDIHSGADRTHEDPSRSAALAMAGLAGHHVDELALFNQQSGLLHTNWHLGSASLGSSSPDGMANDLTSLFEAAGGYVGNGYVGNMGLGTDGTPVTNVPYPMPTPGSGVGDGTASGMDISGFGGGGEDELSRILRDLF